jgi:hypothetical protein
VYLNPVTPSSTLAYWQDQTDLVLLAISLLPTHQSRVIAMVLVVLSAMPICWNHSQALLGAKNLIAYISRSGPAEESFNSAEQSNNNPYNL